MTSKKNRDAVEAQPLRVAIYTRVSTEEQAKFGLSLDAQLEACTLHCQERGYQIVGTYSDPGVSARKSYRKRPGVLSLLDAVAAGRVDRIVFTKLDRWFRNVANYYEVQRELDAAGVSWEAVQEDYETATSTGRFKVNIMLSVAEQEADRTGDRVRATFEHKKAHGEICAGKAAFGYRWAGSTWEKDPDEADAVAAAFGALFSEGSPRAAQLALRERGFPMHLDTVRRMMRSRTYTGEVCGGKIPAYITEEQHRDAVALMGHRARRSSRSDRVYLFSGLVVCRCCGRKLEPATAYNNGTEYRNYACRKMAGDGVRRACPAPAAMSERRIERYLLENLSAHLDASRLTITLDDAEDHSVRRAALEGKRSRLRELYLEGELAADEYRSRRAAIDEDLADLPTPATAPTVDLVDGWRDIYSGLPLEQKRLFWRRTVKKIEVSRATRKSQVIDVEFL